jgi:hypothetical protein
MRQGFHNLTVEEKITILDYLFEALLRTDSLHGEVDEHGEKTRQLFKEKRELEIQISRMKRGVNLKTGKAADASGEGGGANPGEGEAKEEEEEEEEEESDNDGEAMNVEGMNKKLDRLVCQANLTLIFFFSSFDFFFDFFFFFDNIFLLSLVCLFVCLLVS